MGGKTSNASKYKYNSKAYDRIAVNVPKGRKDMLKAAAEAAGYSSLNSFIVDAIQEKIDRMKK